MDKEILMKRIKAFTIISIVLSMGLIACGGRPVKESSFPSSEPPISIPASSDISIPDLSSESILESASEALSSLVNSSSQAPSSSEIQPPSDPLAAFKDNVRNNFNKFHLEEQAIMSEFEEQTFPNSNITYKMGYAANTTNVIDVDGDNVHSFNEVAGGFGVIGLEELALSLNMPRKVLIDNLSSLMPIEYVDDELDMAVIYPIIQSDDEVVWYSEADKQYIGYEISYEDTYPSVTCMYVLESEREVMADTVKEVILSIAEVGTYNSFTNEITLADDQAELLQSIFDTNEITGVKLSIANNYPKQLDMTMNGAAVSFYISEINSAQVTIPDVSPDPCNHYHNHRYDELPNNKHQLYCSSCNKYLAEPENHTLVNNNDHLFCTKCQTVLNLEYAREEIVTIGNGTTYAGIKESQDNNKLYFDCFYYSSNTYSLRNNDTFGAYYYSNLKTLVVFKAYPLNDKLLAEPYSMVTLGYSCFKVVQGVVEIFEDITVSEYSFIAGSLTDAQYQQVRVNKEPVRHYDCYRVFTSHNNAMEVSTSVNACVTLKTTNCQVCQAETNRYAIANHAYDGDKVARVDACHSAYYETCSRCGFELQEYLIEDHINAKYQVVGYETYLKVKYGLTMAVNTVYVEANCPTCHRSFLIEDGSPDPYHATIEHTCNIYEFIHEKLVKSEDVPVIYPHIYDETHVCEICDYIIVDVDDISFFLTYCLDSDGKLAGIYLDCYHSEITVYEDFQEDIVANTWETKLYSDSIKTTLVATLNGDSDGGYIIIKDATGKIVYQATAGEDLPILEFDK